VARNDYHFVITLQFRKEGEPGNQVNTMTGTVAAKRDDTRQTVYQRLLKQAFEGLGASEAVTLFFDLQRNDL
jgi:hypothetical protein